MKEFLQNKAFGVKVDGRHSSESIVEKQCDTGICVDTLFSDINDDVNLTAPNKLKSYGYHFTVLVSMMGLAYKCK